jgi:hypothetical protein
MQPANLKRRLLNSTHILGKPPTVYVTNTGSLKRDLRAQFGYNKVVPAGRGGKTDFTCIIFR